MLVLNLKDMAINPQREVFKAYDFLGLPKEPLTKEGVEAKNVRPTKSTLGEEVKARLEKFYRKWDELFFDSVGFDRSWN